MMMLEEHVDAVTGVFNGAAWRRDNSNSISIIEEAFADFAMSMPPGYTPLWTRGGSRMLGRRVRVPQSTRF